MAACKLPPSGLVASGLLGLALALAASGTAAQDQPKFVVEPVAEKPLAALPDGDLFWHVETFATIEQAKAAATETGVPAEAGGKVWLLTLGPKDMGPQGGEPVGTFGPIQRFDAPKYLLRINVTREDGRRRRGVASPSGRISIPGSRPTRNSSRSRISIGRPSTPAPGS